MKTKSQLHYTDEAQIIARIDAEKERATKHNAAAEHDEAASAKAYREAGDLYEKWEGKDSDEADDGVRQANGKKNQGYLLRQSAIKRDMSDLHHPTQVRYSNQAHEVRKEAIETRMIRRGYEDDFLTCKAFCEEVEKRTLAGTDWREAMRQVLREFESRT